MASEHIVIGIICGLYLTLSLFFVYVYESALFLTVVFLLAVIALYVVHYGKRFSSINADKKYKRLRKDEFYATVIMVVITYILCLAMFIKSA